MIPALLGLLCVAASAIVLVALHLLPTELDPIRFAVSDDMGWLVTATALATGTARHRPDPPRGARHHRALAMPSAMAWLIVVAISLL